ncbi:MAG: response regulator [Ruthenibacterium sp.]
MYQLLIVDDEPNVIEGMKRILQWSDYGFHSIETASTCDEARARAVQCKPDIALIDVRIDDEFGYDLIRQLKEIGLETTFVMVSGYGEFKYACEAMRSGAYDYLLKPVRAEKLQKCIEKIIVEKLGGQIQSHEKTLWNDPVLNLQYEQFPPLIGKILMMVRAEYAQNITLKSIADRFRMNATYLGQIFIKETRLKFSEYLMLYRLMIARDRILFSDDKIASIAVEVGYSNLNYFYTNFHNYFNMTPSEMRANR